MELDGNFMQVIEGALFRKHAVEAMFVSTMMLLIYDWSLMLSREVQYIWRASWNYTKVLYLLTRYIPFVSLSLLLRNQFTLDTTPDSCRKSLRAACWTAIVGVDLTEIVLMVRTCAVWDNDKRVGAGLAALLVLCQIPNGIFVERFIEVIDFIKNPYPEIYQGCLAISATKIFFVNWVVFTIMEGVTLVLMFISALRTCRGGTSNFIYVVYVDGMRFYVYMFLVTVANILLTLLLPIDFVGIGSSIEIVLHSHLACRLIVGIREASQSTGYQLGTFELSGIPSDNSVVFAQADQRGLPNESTFADLEARADAPKP